MKRVLSTKILSRPQKELLLNSGLLLVEYNAISIELLSIELPPKIENAIFTSQNAVRAFLKNKPEDYTIKQIFCVGEKTAALLAKNGQNVVKIEEYGTKLANFISKSFENETFYFFSGNLRADDILTIAKTSKNSIFELNSYKTSLNIKKFDQFFDGIMFFSPSGVQSFASKNLFTDIPAICIGETTATEARKYSKKVLVANSTSVESVIAKTVKTQKRND